MPNQVELRARVPDDIVEILDGYFFETESPYWGIMQKEITDPYDVFGIFPDSETAQAELAKLRADFPKLVADFAETPIIDADWQNAYKEFVKPWSNR
ncbi:MAG: hypothetical protein NWT02_04505, partial [Opitutales bacterium]|nr:hypothetical protein [Opitutales bacterium]MDP4644757.1 hypothetical protein [Opitutales bacterium]MDP4883819.1 hypothetical protein [Opitutales bacterium]